MTNDYTAKGTYQPYGGIEKAYVTGPAGTGKALVVIFDIFGRVLSSSLLRFSISDLRRYFPQTLQGADILAESMNAWVVMPDFVHGEAFPIEKFPAKTDEDKAALGNFFKTTGNPETKLPEISAVCEALKKEGYGKVGVLGYCWGKFVHEPKSYNDSIVVIQGESFQRSPELSVIMSMQWHPCTLRKRRATVPD